MKSKLIAAASFATLTMLGATSVNAALPTIPYVTYLTAEDIATNDESSAGAGETVGAEQRLVTAQNSQLKPEGLAKVRQKKTVEAGPAGIVPPKNDVPNATEADVQQPISARLENTPAKAEAAVECEAERMGYNAPCL